jgi:hypothetical protein
MHQQPPPKGTLSVAKVNSPQNDSVVKARFLVDTNHPDYGKIFKGDVLPVTRAYLDHYISLGMAEEYNG